MIMTTPTSTSGFGPAATEFFEDLEDQNTREFWLAHKDVFDREVREPMAALLDSLPEEYQPFKVFRMNRDVRFSADKSPYKTMHGAAHGVPGAVYYLHLDASGLMVACGSYMMQPEELERYRQAVAADLLRQKGVIAMRTRPGSELQNGARLRSFVVGTFQMCGDLTNWLRRYVGAST